MSKKVKKLFLLDIMNLAFRAFYAFGGQQLATKDGKLTSMCFGVAGAINRLVDDYRPDYIVIARDLKGKTFRHALDPNYKATRGPINPDVLPQLKDLDRMLEAFGLKVVAMEGFEADDIIGSFATQYASEEVHAFIVSNDKDFMQLVNPNVHICRPLNGGGYELGNLQMVLNKFDCGPAQVVDCLALMGDTSDNVPGVRGIGGVGASKLVKSYGSLEGIYGSLGMIKGAMNKKLTEGMHSAFLSKSLVTIKKDLVLPPLEEFAVDCNTLGQTPDIQAFYSEMEFASKMGGNGSLLEGPSILDSAFDSAFDIE